MTRTGATPRAAPCWRNWEAVFLTKHATPTAVDAGRRRGRRFRRRFGDVSFGGTTRHPGRVVRRVFLHHKKHERVVPRLAKRVRLRHRRRGVRGLPECDETFVSGGEKNNDDAYAAEPAFTSTERDADGTTLVATWVWREGYVVDDGT